MNGLVASGRAAALLCALLVLGAAPWPSAAAEAMKAGVFDPPREAPDFLLRGSDGADATLGRFRGKVVVLVFGFTSCPQVCPTTLSTLARARRDLGAEADGLQVLYVTVDPERDDLVRLREYLKAFDPAFVGATGEAAALEAVRREFGISAARVVEGSTHTFQHSSFTYLIDRDGLLRALMPYGSPAADYVHDVRLLLAEPRRSAPSSAGPAASPAAPPAPGGGTP